MDVYPENIMKVICCTCLSKDRKLFQLCRIDDAVNNLFWLLSYDSGSYSASFHRDTTNMYICWECRALMARVIQFRQQVCAAQKMLTTIADGWTDIKSNSLSLSRLSRYYNTDYKTLISQSDDNFVDCGPEDIKMESDDDVPLSELNIISQNYKTRKRTSKKKLCVNSNLKKETINRNCGKKMLLPITKKTDKKLEEHVAGRKSELAFSDAIYRCHICIKNFDSQSDLDVHNTELHIKGSDTVGRNVSGSISKRTYKGDKVAFGFQCGECNMSFDNKNQRWKHVQRTHREGYQCAACDKRFAFKNNLTRHELLHTSPPPRKECPTCGKQVRVDLWKAHARSHGPRQAFTCRECDKRFVSRASYEHHLKYTQAHAVGDLLKHKCPSCGKGYRSKGELRDHVNYQHVGKAQHTCPECGKALATRRCVTRHVRRAHRGLKENAKDKICQQCGKAFRDAKGLREHEWIHSGERPLACEHCSRTFRQSAALYAHTRRVHSVGRVAGVDTRSET